MALTVLILMSVLLFADQNVMNPVIKDIMAEYKINESQVVFPGAALLTGVIPGSILMTLKLTPGMGSSSMITATIACFITGFVITVPGPNVKAILLNVNPPEQRGSVFAIHNLTDSVGKGVGPIIGGVLITSHGYLYTMLFSVYMWIPWAIIYILMAFTLNKDVARLKDYLTKKRNGLSLN